MRLGLNVSGAARRGGAGLSELARTAERLGYSSLWTGEAYGTDAVVPLAWMAAVTSKIRLGSAVLQIPGRTPAMTGMTAMSLAELSAGRFVLGLGLSGPRIAEGWHGSPASAPLRRTREYVDVVRQVLAGAAPVALDGRCYRIPYRGDDATGLGAPVRPMDHTQHDVPIYLAAIGPKNVRLATEIADGLLPIMWSPTQWRNVYPGDVFERATPGFDLAPTVWTAVGDDLASCRDVVRRHIAFYVGAMGPPGNNYYADLISRYGHEETVEKVTACYAERRAGDAAAFVSDELVDDLGLVGPRGHLAEQLDRWRDSPVGTLIVEADDPVALEVLAELTQ